MERLVTENALKEEGLSVRLPAHEVRLNTTEQATVNAFLKALAENPYSPATDRIPEPDLLNLLIERRQVVKASEAVIFSAKAFDEMVAKITGTIKSHGKITLAEVRDMFQTTRKYAQPLLEYMDEKKITRRVGDDRVLY